MSTSQIHKLNSDTPAWISTCSGDASNIALLHVQESQQAGATTSPQSQGSLIDAYQEPEQNRQATEVRAKCNDKDAANAQHENIAYLTLIDRIRTHMPDRSLWQKCDSAGCWAIVRQ